MTKRVSFDANSAPRFPEGAAEAVMRAFEGYDSDASTVVVPRREHLGTEWRKGVCCEHRWRLVPPSEENTRRLAAIFEETDLGVAQSYCTRCGAVALYEAQDRYGLVPPKLVAYDATARYGLPPLERKEQPRGRQSTRSRR